MGVEPTKDRLAAPPGFEVRTPHRGRFSSWNGIFDIRRIARVPEQVEAMLVDASYVTATQSDAMPVEKFQDLDRDLAPVVEAIAELRRTELTIGGL